MLANIVVVIIGVTALTLIPDSLAIPCSGCVDLDEINFDRIITRFPYALVKFDIAFPYGEKHEAFAEFSRAAHKATEDLVVGSVGIKDYGENENKDLGARFKVDDKNFPEIILFRGSVEDYVKFPGHLDVTAVNLKSFVSKNTDLYIGNDGCLKEFNDLAKNFANAEDVDQEKTLKEADRLAEALSKDSDRINAKSYLTFMRKIRERGYRFVEEETKRLQRLKAGKVNDSKKVELMHKLNILEAFRVTKLTKKQPAESQDEL